LADQPANPQIVEGEMMPWILEKEFTFEAAHKLPHHDGKCARLHGHGYRMIVYVESDRLIESGPKQGMVMDYGDISAIVKPFVEEYLDHWYLNESTGLENPTSEELARWMFEQLRDRGLPLHSIKICETCTSAATYAHHHTEA